MLIPQRQARLQEVLSQRGMCDLDSLAAELGVSQSTVRRDVELLAEKGLVTRTHGGVVWSGDQNAPSKGPYAFDQRMGYQGDAKRKIAQAAAKLISPGETVLIDGGTTTFYLAQNLMDMSLQVVTNSLPIANLFHNEDQVELILTGGLMYPRYGVLLGPTAESMLAQIHTKTVFFGVAGVYQGTLYNQNLLLVQAEHRMMKQAQQTILLADSTKFGQQALVRLCALEEVDVVVSDAGLSDADRKMVRGAGCELVIAE